MLTWAIDKVQRSYRSLSRRLKRWAFAGVLVSAAPYISTWALEVLGVSLPSLWWSPASLPLGILGLVASLTYFVGLFLQFRTKTFLSSSVSLEDDLSELRIRPESGGATDSSRGHRFAFNNITAAYFVPHEQNAEEGTLRLATPHQEWSLFASSAMADEFLERTKLGPQYRRQLIESADRIGCSGPALMLLTFPVACLTVPSPLVHFSDAFALSGADGAGMEILGVVFILAWITGSVFLSVELGHALSTMLNGFTLDLGTDGIRWKSLGSKQFVAYSEIENVNFVGVSTPNTQSVILTTKDGRAHKIPISGANPHNLSIVRQRVKGALGQAATLLMPQLEKGELSDTDWRAGLRRLLELGADYRRAAVPKERVLEILQDGAASPAQRVGAGIALVEAESPEAHRVLVSVSESTANPELREELEELVVRAEEFAERGSQ